jgi:hypothetical protein
MKKTLLAQGEKRCRASNGQPSPEHRRGLPHIFFHPDYTVGPGIAPDLLTPFF